LFIEVLMYSIMEKSAFRCNNNRNFSRVSLHFSFLVFNHKPR